MNNKSVNACTYREAMPVVLRENVDARNYLTRGLGKKRQDVLRKVKLIQDDNVGIKNDPTHPINLARLAYKGDRNELGKQFVLEGKLRSTSSRDLNEKESGPMEIHENVIACENVFASEISRLALADGDLTLALEAFASADDLSYHEPEVKKFVDYFEVHLTDVGFVNDVLPKLYKDKERPGMNLLINFTTNFNTNEYNTSIGKDLGQVVEIVRDLLWYKSEIAPMQDKFSAYSRFGSKLSGDLKVAAANGIDYDSSNFLTEWRKVADTGTTGQHVVDFMKTEYYKGLDDKLKQEIKRHLLVVTLHDICDISINIKSPSTDVGVANQILELVDDVPKVVLGEMLKTPDQSLLAVAMLEAKREEDETPFKTIANLNKLVENGLKEKVKMEQRKKEVILVVDQKENEEVEVKKLPTDLTGAGIRGFILRYNLNGKILKNGGYSNELNLLIVELNTKVRRDIPKTDTTHLPAGYGKPRYSKGAISVIQSEGIKWKKFYQKEISENNVFNYDDAIKAVNEGKITHKVLMDMIVNDLKVEHMKRINTL